MSTVANSSPHGNLANLSQRERELGLAVAVLRENVARLSAQDRADLNTLMPILLEGDEEDRESAWTAACEILFPPKMSISRADLDHLPSEKLQKWIDFFSDRLKTARVAADMTQEQLANLSGVPQSYISRLENGQHSPTAKTMEKLAGALGISISELDPSAE